MKKKLLKTGFFLATVLLAGNLFAQNLTLIDFATLGTGYQGGTVVFNGITINNVGAGGDYVGFQQTNHQNAIYPSTYALWIQRAAGAGFWSGCIMQNPTWTATPISGYSYMHVLMYRENNNAHFPRVKVSDSPATEIPMVNTPTLPGQWQDCVFNITGIPVSFVMIMLDYEASPGAGSSSVPAPTATVGGGVGNVILSNDPTSFTQVATPTISPAGGNVSAPVTVTLNCATTGATIYYTLDGSDPATSSTATAYATPFTVSTTKTVKAIAKMALMTNSVVVSTVYNFGPPPPSVVISGFYTSGGSANSPVLNKYVELYNTTSSPIDIGGWTIYHASTTSANAANTITLPIPTMIGAHSFILCKGGQGSSTATQTNPYTFNADLTVNNGGNVTNGFNISTSGKILLCSNSTNSFTTANSFPTTLSAIQGLSGYVDYVVWGTGTPALGGTFASLDVTTAAVRTFTGTNISYSPDMAADFIVQPFTYAKYVARPSSTSISVIPAPVIAPLGSITTAPVTVKINCARADATIYYTTDGTDPTTSSTATVYSAPFTVSATTTVKAYATDGITGSSINSEFYNFKAATPTFVPTPTVPTNFEITSPITVAINTTTAGATIYYTTDGTKPTIGINPYSAPLTVSSTTTIKAIAGLNGMLTSDTATVTYKYLVLPTSAPNVVISGLYPGGGATSPLSPLRNDYIELYNTTSAPVDISNWTLYYIATGGNAKVTDTYKFQTGTIIGAYGFLLCKGAVNGTNSTQTTNTYPTVSNNLTTGTVFDVDITTNGADVTAAGITEKNGINLNSVTGRLLLLDTWQDLSTGSKISTSSLYDIQALAGFKDYVSWGTATPPYGTTMNFANGATIGASRKITGTTVSYTPSMAGDFTLGEIITAVNPRNSTTVLTVDTPVIAPASGNISGPTTVTITCASAGAAIHYTLDGSDPTTSATAILYSAPFTVSATTTVKAYASIAGLTSSNVVSATYNFKPAVVISGFYAGGGASSSAPVQNNYIELYNTTSSPIDLGGYTIYATGSALSNALSAANKFTFNTGTIIAANGFLLLKGAQYSATASTQGNPYPLRSNGTPFDVDITINGTGATPVTTGFKISNTGGGILLLHNNSSETTLPSTTALIKALTGYVDYVSWGTASSGNPTFVTILAALTNTTAASRKFTGNDIAYTPNMATDFSALTVSFDKYVARSSEYTFTKAIVPTISPAGSIVTSTVNVSLHCISDLVATGAKVYYTTDGSDPATSSTRTLYSAAFPVSVTTTVQAIAEIPGMANSDIVSEKYDFKAITPVITPTPAVNSSNEFTAPISVAITCATTGATIYYTLDGSDPATSGTAILYGGAFSVSATTTVKAVALVNGMITSDLAQRTFTYVPLPPCPSVVISGAYANGGVSGAPVLNDYIELYNTTSSPVDISGWAIYSIISGSNATAGNSFKFPPGTTICANGFLLLKGAQRSKNSTQTNPYTFDVDMTQSVIDSTSFNLGNSGKLLLLSQYKDLTSATGVTLPTSLAGVFGFPGFVDYVVWGTTSVAEPIKVGTSLAAMTTTTAISRKITGTTVSYGPDMGADFSSVTLTASVPRSAKMVTAVATPTFTPAGGIITAPVTVSFDCATASCTAAGVTYYYTTDGSTPTTGSTPYNNTPIPISATTTVKVIAVVGTVSSAVATATYTYIPPATSGVIITGVYGGGGNSGAIFLNDYIELYDSTANDIDLGGWTIYYTSASGTSAASNNTFTFAAGTIIKSHGFLLLKAAKGGGTQPSLNADVDISGAGSNFSMSSSQGKVLLLSQYTNLTATNALPVASFAALKGLPGFSDYVAFGAYGATNAPTVGSAMVNLSNTTAARRIFKDNKVSYTPDMGLDFHVVPITGAVPRNSSFKLVRNIAEYLALPQGTVAQITNDVTAIYLNGINLYVKDNTDYMLVNGVELTGQLITNGVTISGASAQLGTCGNNAPWAASPLAWETVGMDLSVAPTVYDLATATIADQSHYVTVQNVQFAADAVFSTTTANSATLVAPAGFPVVDNFKIGGTYPATNVYEITGFMSFCNGTAQLFPVLILPATKCDINNSNAVKIYSDNANVVVDNAKAGQQITVYDLAGQVIVNRVAVDGTNRIPFTEQGVLIVRCGEKVEKVIIK